MPGFAVVVLAAGGSSRLGHPKQLVQFEGEPLVRRAVRTALESGAEQVLVVVGASSVEVIEALIELPVEIVENSNWQLGLSSSIRSGIDSLHPDLDAVVLTLCDVPAVTPSLLSDLAEAAAKGDPPVAAAEYNCHLGPPCAFHRSLFEMLRNLTGDRGARAIVEAAPKVVRIEFPGGTCDIHTPPDLKRLFK